MKKKFLSPLTRTERINQLKKAYSDALDGGWWIEDIEPDPKSDEAQKAYPHLWQRLGDNIVQIIGYGGGSCPRSMNMSMTPRNGGRSSVRTIPSEGSLDTSTISI